MLRGDRVLLLLWNYMGWSNNNERGYSSNSGADSIGHGGHVSPLLQIAGHGGTVNRRTANNKTDQSVLIITKVLAKTTNCTFRATKVEGHDKQKFPAICVGSVPPTFARYRAPYTFKFVPALLISIMQYVEI